MAAPTQEFPQPFGKYTLLRKLARGGMAELFLARMAGSPRLYVIKRILPDMAMDRQFLSMFLTEARVAAQLVHPNIISIYDLGREGTHFYLSMEYIDGIDLEHLVKICGGKIPPDVMARICADLCGALHFANRSIDMSTGKPLNVIHRDVTPGNVMITRQGVVKLVDFGVAKATAQLERTKAGVVKGKFRYMSPEQLQLHELDGRSDLFSVGVLLYEMSTGLKPFDRPQVIEIIRALTNWDPPPPAKAVPGYPKPISEVVVRALSKDREQRFSDGTQMRLALEKALAALPERTDVQAFVSRFLPPPIAVPPPIPEAALAGARSPSPPRPLPKAPEKSRPLPELDEAGADDQATMVGRPIFDAQVRAIGHRPPGTAPARGSAGARLPKSPAEAGSAPAAADIDAEDRWDALLPRSAAPLSTKRPPRPRSAGHAPPTPARAQLPKLSGQRPPEPDNDDEGTVAMRSAPRRGKSKDVAVDAGAMAAARAPGSADQPHPRKSAERRAAMSGGAPAHGAGAAAEGASRRSDGRRAASPAKAKVSRPQVEVQQAEGDDDDDVPLDWRPSRDAAAQISLSEQERLALEEPADPAARRRLPSIVALLILAFGIGGAFAYLALQRPSAEAPPPAVKGKGRIVIDGQGFVSFDGRRCDLPCFRNVDANTPHKVVHGSDPARFRELSVAPDQTIRMAIDDL